MPSSPIALKELAAQEPLAVSAPAAPREDVAGISSVEARARIEAVAEWIGRPEGRGQIVPQTPEPDAWREVHTWEADGSLSTRRVCVRKLLGSGLAGTVFLAEDDKGNTFIEKHFGEVPSHGSKKMGRKLTALLFTLFRQAPLSYRELPQAVVSSHLANRFIVAAARTRFGRAITPPLLYTRYDAETGGYVQAFTFVEGRPLRPWDYGLPLLGEAGLFFRQMQQWRDFLAKDLGFWGLARQVDPANPNSFSNVWITPDRHVLLLDVVPGVAGFLEARYLWWGLMRGHLPPFGDAIDFARLEKHVQRNPPAGDAAQWRRDLEMLRAATISWQNSEPRLPSSPLRVWRVLTDPAVKDATRRATLTHIEVKGAISKEEARRYREVFARTGKFPKFLRHTLLKMAPLHVHKVATDGAYLRRVLGQGWTLPLRLVRGVARRAGKAVVFVLRKIGTAWKLVINRQERLQRCRAEVGGWIDEEEKLGRLTPRQSSRLRATLESDTEIADIVNVFALHLALGALKQAATAGLPPSPVWLAAAFSTGNWWLALPAFIDPVLRVGAVLWTGLGRHLSLLFFSALPTVGIMAAPLFLLRRRPILGGFMLRSFGRKAALHVPGFGERGSLLEMLGVAAAQTLVVDAARVLPPILLLVMIGAATHQRWVVALAAGLYAATVAWSLLTRRREARSSSSKLFGHVANIDIDTQEKEPWKLGMPEPLAPLAQSRDVKNRSFAVFGGTRVS